MSSYVFRTAFDLSTNRINWYPGHMAKTMRLLVDQHLKRAHVVIEVRDARIPYSSTNGDLDVAIGGKPRIIVLNKADLVPKRDHRRIKEYVRKSSPGCIDALMTVSDPVEPQGITELITLAKEHLPSRFKTTPRVMLVVGMPNVGKSALLNSLRAASYIKGKTATVGAFPGVTRQIAGFAVHRDPPMFVLDSPGVMVPSFLPEDKELSMRIGLCGGIPDDIVDLDYLCDYLLYWMNRHGNFAYQEFCEPAIVTDNVQYLLKNIDNYLTRGAVKVHGRWSSHNAAVFLLKKFRLGEFGKMLLDDDRI